MNWEVVRLSVGDGAAFRAMNDLFGAVFDDESYSRRPPSADYVERLLADDRFVALVVERERETIGALVAYELVKFEAERSELYIYDLAVAERWRRRGVATALIDRLRHHASSVGAWVIYVQADPPDAPAVALYESLGTREEVFHYDITPGGGPIARR